MPLRHQAAPARQLLLRLSGPGWLQLVTVVSESGVSHVSSSYLDRHCDCGCHSGCVWFSSWILKSLRDLVFFIPGFFPGIPEGGSFSFELFLRMKAFPSNDSFSFEIQFCCSMPDKASSASYQDLSISRQGYWLVPASWKICPTLSTTPTWHQAGAPKNVM